jgi:hypothetical protein
MNCENKIYFFGKDSKKCDDPTYTRAFAHQHTLQGGKEKEKTYPRWQGHRKHWISEDDVMVIC